MFSIISVLDQLEYAEMFAVVAKSNLAISILYSDTVDNRETESSYVFLQTNIIMRALKWIN